MKKLYTLLLVLAMTAQAFASSGSSPEPPLKASEVYFPVGSEGKLISLEQLSVIKAKDLEKMTGQKLSLKEKIALKGAQRQLRNNINYDGTLDENFQKALAGGISWGGLALGLFLLLIGVLIAYLLKNDNRASMIKWAWIGCIIGFIIWGVAIL